VAAGDTVVHALQRHPRNDFTRAAELDAGLKSPIRHQFGKTLIIDRITHDDADEYRDEREGAPKELLQIISTVVIARRPCSNRRSDGYEGLRADVEALASGFGPRRTAARWSATIERFSHTVAVDADAGHVDATALPTEAWKNGTADAVVYTGAVRPRVTIKGACRSARSSMRLLAGFARKIGGRPPRRPSRRCLVHAMRHARCRGRSRFGNRSANGGGRFRHAERRTVTRRPAPGALEYMRNNNARFPIHCRRGVRSAVD